MHSLKNTIVAVGLLGLSFLFYQASSNKSPESDDMIPALEISDGNEDTGLLASAGIGLSTESTTAIDMPKVDVPELIKPKTGLPDFASNFKAKVNADAFPANDFSGNGLPKKTSAAPKSSSAMSPAGSGNRGGSAVGGNAVGDNATKDKSSRDEELIAALKAQSQVTGQSQFSGQNQFASTKPPTNNSLVAQPDSAFKREPPINSQTFEADGGGSQFKSQSIPASDSSYNAMASSDSNRHNSDVVHADLQPASSNLNFQAVWPQVDQLIAQDKYRDALRLLSGYYRSPDLNGPQRQRLLPWLDGLAGKVIFSTEHHLEKMPYTVGNESLVDIGNRWKVPAQLIYNINQAQIPNPASISGGTELKMVRGPFNAEIDTQQNVMTLFLGDLYAGRFPIRVGISGDPKPGNFRVLVKSATGHAWRDAEGNNYPPGAPENGYGPNWIGLSGSLCIHAVDDSATDGHHGCIGLSPKDATDVFAILTDGSSVKILR